MTFLGIDGGGSKTTFLLENDEGRELARFETGPSNWLSSGAVNARESLTHGIQRLPSLPDVVCGGFAGAGRPEGVEFYRSCLVALLPRRPRCLLKPTPSSPTWAPSDPDPVSC